MFKSIASALIAASALAYTAPTQAQMDSVKEFDTVMKHYNRSYEVHNVKTDDDWELTLFRVMPANVNQKTERSVLFQHGLTMDAAGWLESTRAAQPEGSTELPTFLRLADDGYDVWMGNSRATNYSRVNANFPYADDISYYQYYVQQNKAKYDTDWADVGKSDVPAMLDKITAESGNEKVTYVGFQAGGSAAIWGLATMED